MNLEDIQSFLVTGKAGDEIFRGGDPGAEMYIVRQGQIELAWPRPGGRIETVVVRAGEFFGEESLFEHQPRPGSARALTDYQLIRVDAAALTAIVNEDPGIAVQLIRGLARRASAAVVMSTSGLKPVLVHQVSGRVFPIAAGGELTVGRASDKAGVKPEIDLSEFDPERTLSRRHAHLINRDGTLYVRGVSEARNGTFVNGRRVDTSETLVKAGDRISFGLVETVVRYD